MEQFIKDLKELYGKGNFTEVITQGTPLMEARPQGEGEYDFANVYQQMLFSYGFGNEKAEQVAVPFGTVCLLVGAAYLEKEQYSEAKYAFKLAANWDPVSVEPLTCLCEVAKKEEDTDEVFRLTRLMLPLCYSGKDLSRCYRNFAYCATENGMMDDAAVFYYAALAFGDTEDEVNIRGELAFLTMRLQKVIKEPTADQIMELFGRWELPFGFHPVHAQLAEILQQQAEEVGAPDLVTFAANIIKEVTA